MVNKKMDNLFKMAMLPDFGTYDCKPDHFGLRLVQKIGRKTYVVKCQFLLEIYNILATSHLKLLLFFTEARNACIYKCM